MRSASWEAAWLQDETRRIVEAMVWRGVETQYASSTLLLVDSHAEHDVLEALVERSKPALPAMRDIRKHYLLATPFRYTPRHDSRFRKAGAGRHGLWYGARQLQAACAEVAYWRMRFISDSAGLLDQKIVTTHTFFASAVDGVGIDLMDQPWSVFRDLWVRADDYIETHRLAAMAEGCGIEAIRYESVRAPGSTCVAVLAPDALSEPVGGLDATRQKWTCLAARDRVMMANEADDSQRYETDA